MRIGIREEAAGRRERGAALIVVMVTVMVTAALSLSLLLVATGRNNAVEARRRMEAALAVAEAGLARGMAEANLIANRSNRWWPDAAGVNLTGTSAELRDAENGTTVMGRFVVNLQSGAFDGKDNDGDGNVDAADTDPLPPAEIDPSNPGENNFITIVSTGYFGSVEEGNPYKVRVTGEIYVERNAFLVSGALAIGGSAPDIDLQGAALNINGYDHDDDSNDIYDAGDPNDLGDPALEKPAIAVAAPDLADPAETAAIELLGDDIGPPSSPADTLDGPVTIEFNAPTNPMDTIVSWAKANATFTTLNTLPDNFDYGSVIYHKPPLGTPVVVNGNLEGAGIWVVEGDLEFYGTVQFKGILIVTGSLTFSGGGNDYMLRGAAIVGGNATVDFSNNGTPDVRYSSEAVTKAMNSNVFYTMQAWRQISTNP